MAPIDKVATGSYFCSMKTVGIKYLKNNLSAVLREVRRGEHFLVTDRDEVVAELREPGAEYHVPEATNAKLQEWIERGIVRPPREARGPLPIANEKSLVPKGFVQEQLDWDRQDDHDG